MLLCRVCAGIFLTKPAPCCSVGTVKLSHPTMTSGPSVQSHLDRFKIHSSAQEPQTFCTTVKSEGGLITCVTGTMCMSMQGYAYVPRSAATPQPNAKTAEQAEPRASIHTHSAGANGHAARSKPSSLFPPFPQVRCCPLLWTHSCLILNQ